MIFKRKQETEKKYFDQTRKSTPPKKRQKEWPLRNDCLKKKNKRKNNPNTGLRVELLVYLLDHSLIERLLVWCVTAVITFFLCHRRYAPPKKKK